MPVTITPSKRILFLVVLITLFLSDSFSQKNNTIPLQTDTLQTSGEGKDIRDVLKKVFAKDTVLLKELSIRKKTGRLHMSAVPAVGYALQTGFAAAIAANGAFYTDEHENSNLSVVTLNAVYSEKHQFLLPIQSNIWTEDNKYNFVGDWRYYKYPQYTYGLGGHTNLANADLLNYSYLTIRQTVLRHIYKDFYVGLGYMLDHHWNIVESGLADGSVTDFQKYGVTSKSTSSGITFNLLHDDRRNPINPSSGDYVNLVFRCNTTLLSSDQNTQSLILDLRKYFKLPNNSKNVLAMWAYTWLTLSGKPPYLDLPSTAWDTYSNLGRGYIQSRLRGLNLLYLETEYRFAITKNGLLGGVFFANAQSVSDWPSNKFEVILPGLGTGIRLKINKHSNTNIAIDYGFGIGGSNGIFVNLGEVF